MQPGRLMSVAWGSRAFGGAKFVRIEFTHRGQAKAAPNQLKRKITAHKGTVISNAYVGNQWAGATTREKS